MGWTHMVRMKDEILPKRADPKKQGGCRKRGRLQLRMEDCLKGDRREAAEEEVGRKDKQQGAIENTTKVGVQQSDK